MTKFTKERLTELANFKPSGSNSVNSASREEWQAMARQLLAGLEHEPLYQVRHGDQWRDLNKAQYDDHVNLGADGLRILYAAPQLPQPVVVPTFDEWCAATDNTPLGWVKDAMREAYDGCRAAMLQGAELVSQPDELPMDYQLGHKDGLEWAARLAEANHPQTGDWLYDDPLELAKAIRKGPDMPVEPVQGWIPCGERMPEEIGRYWCYVEEQNSLGKSHYQWNCSWNGDRWWVESENGGRVTHWMPLQEPPKQTAES